MQKSELFKKLTEDFKPVFQQEARREAELLLQGALGQSPTEFLLSEQNISLQLQNEILSLAERRKQGEPLSYLLGYKDFFKSRFAVSPAVLIPRPETELLVELPLQLGRFEHIADLGVGSGCIGLSLLLEYPRARLWGCDLSLDALLVAQKNADSLQLSKRAEFVGGDPLDFPKENEFDLVVSNPPYIAREDLRLQEEVKKFEPALALYAEQDGLQFYKSWIPWIYKSLKNSGWVMFEVGQDQAAAVQQILQQYQFQQVRSEKDLSGIERVVLAQKG